METHRPWAKITEGRFLERGLTLRSALLTIGLSLAAIFVAGLLAERAQPEYPISVDVLESRIAGSAPDCRWEVDLRFNNESDRDMRLVSVEIPEVADSQHFLLGSFAVDDSIDRTFRYGPTDCSIPDIAELLVRYGPTITTKERSLVFSIE